MDQSAHNHHQLFARISGIFRMPPERCPDGSHDAGHAGVHQRRVLGAITGFIAFHVFSDPIDGGRYVFAHGAVLDGEWVDDSEISSLPRWSFIESGGHPDDACRSWDCAVGSLGELPMMLSRRWSWQCGTKYGSGGSFVRLNTTTKTGHTRSDVFGARSLLGAL